MANPVGRPSRFKDLDMDSVKYMVERGFTDREIQRIMKVPTSIWCSWLHQYPEFKELVDSWKKFANQRVERALFERAIGYEHEEVKVNFDKDGNPSVKTVIKHIAPSEGAAKLWLINRGEDWHDKKEIDASLKGGIVLRWQDENDESTDIIKELPEWLK